MDIEQLRLLCKALPAVTEEIKWDNDLCFLVGRKMFCVTSLDPPLRVSFKVPDEDFDELVAREGFIPAPYMARARWVSVLEPHRVKPKAWKDFIGKSYALVSAKLTKKARKELGI